MALGRRAAADHRLQPRHAPRSSAATSSCSPRKGVAGLGFGTGFDHKRLPKAILEAAREHGLPLFEVPYEMPFIAITERAAARLVNEQYGVLERGVQVHERLERLVIEGRGLEEILGLDAGARSAARRWSSTPPDASSPAGAAAAGRRRTAAALAAEIADARRGDGAPAFAPEQPRSPAARSRSRSRAARGGPPVAWLVVSPSASALGDFERLCARQAAIVVGLELMRERIVRETERRLAGDLLADALGGRLEAEELRGRLRPFGIGAEAAVLVFDLEDPPAAEATLESALADAGVPALVATSAAAGRPLLCAVVDSRRRDPIGTARRARGGARRRPRRDGVRAAASRAAPASARCAAPSTRRAARSRRPRSPTAAAPTSPRTATSAPSPCCSRSRTTTRCASTATGCWTRSSAPRASTAASCCARWRRSSRTTATGSGPRAQLYCHRHTLRYRIRKIEELTGRDLEPGDGPDRALAGAQRKGAGPIDPAR